MPISSLLLGLTLALVVLPFVLKPFLRRTRLSPASADVAAHPAVTKEAALVALRDLDFDYQTGKVVATDYAPLRRQLLSAAAEAAQREKQARRRTQAPVDVDADIEAAVFALRRGERAAGRRCPACGHAASPADKFCGRCGASLEQVCPNCHAAVGPTDRFCATCGASLAAQADTTS